MGTIWQPDLKPGAGAKYKRVVAEIREGVQDGSLAVGDKLPPVRDLAWTLKITPGTVARAYSILTDEGVLRAEVGRGTFVAAPVQEGPSLNLIEMDSVVHNSEGDADQVNLNSPHLPNAGQAELIRHLLGQIAKNPPSGVMHYPSLRAAEPARVAMAAWLADVPAGSITAHDLVLTLGGQNAIMLAFQTILWGRKPLIFVEELAYPGFRRAADALRADVVAIEMDAQGIVPDALAAAAKRYPDAQILCTSPEVHSPTCGFTPAARRQEIVAVARRFDLQIVEDDCYRLGRSQGPCYRQLAPERGWYLTSLSKSITPALRIGCAVAPKGRAGALQRSAEHAFFGLPTLMSDLCTQLLTHPSLPAISAKARVAIEGYVKTAVNILGGYDLAWRADVPFLWLQLPLGWRASAFCRAAEAEGIQLRAAEEFAGREAQSPHAVRFAINAGVSMASFERAMQKLLVLLDNPPDRISV